MEIIFYIIICALIFVSFGLISAIYKSKKRSEATSGIVNHNSQMSKFVFKVDLTRDETIAVLLTKCATDTLTCSFDFDMSVITFSDFWNDEKYYFVFQNSVLRLELASFRGRQSSIKYKLTPFIVNKLKAEAVPFSENDVN